MIFLLNIIILNKQLSKVCHLNETDDKNMFIVEEQWYKVTFTWHLNSVVKNI